MQLQQIFVPDTNGKNTLNIFLNEQHNFCVNFDRIQQMTAMRVPDPIDFHQINSVIEVAPYWNLGKNVRLQVVMNVG